jgi:hypothetical protein
MQLLIWSFVVAVLLAPVAVAQPLAFGEATPLTTMRYVPYQAAHQGAKRMLSSGAHPYLLWTENSKVRITPITGVRRVGRPVLDALFADGVWTGSYFVVAGHNGTDVVGRRVGGDGEPIGPPFTIVEDAPIGQTRLAFDGSRVLLVFGGEGGLRWLYLNRDGTPVGEAQAIPIENVTPPMSLELTARAGEFLLAVGGRTSVATGSLKNTGWTTGLTPAQENFERQVTIAANATDTLTIWTNRFAPLEARVTSLDRPGQVTTYTLADTSNADDVAASWDGKDFIYTYAIGMRLSARYFNAPFPFWTTDTGGDRDIHQVSLNGRTLGAWNGRGGNSPVVVADVVSTIGDVAAFGASSQSVATSTSSTTSALFVWREGFALHAGIRSVDGRWTEGQIPTEDDHAAMAASDGRDFVIVHYRIPDTSQFDGWSSTLLDADGRVLGNGPRVSFFPTDIVWTGTAYAVVGISSTNQVVASLLSPAGTITAPVAIAAGRTGRSLIDADIASREGELLITWLELDNQICPQPTAGCFIPRTQLLGSRATPLLQRTDAQALLLVDEAADQTDTLWDGTRYVIAWSYQRKMRYRALRTNSAISGVTSITGAEGNARLVALTAGVATTADGKIVLLRDGAADAVIDVGVRNPSLLEKLGSRAAYVESIARDEAPYHGAARLHIRIGDVVAPAPRPSAPQITRAVLPTSDVAMIIEWTAPPEPVNGYRVEYRVDDSVWNELDEWFDARSTQLVIRPWRTDTARYQFRVRAVNDAGFSSYSEPATVRTRKMRAVR